MNISTQAAIRADYHMHTTVSDGQLAPSEVVRRAAQCGVKQMAITDHDDFGGYAEGLETALQVGIRLITGVEISTTWHEKTIHILGYHFDARNAEFAQRLANMRATREERSNRIADKLHALGFPNTLKGAQAIAGRQTPISRTHFARYLVREGYCRNFAEAMNKYLADGKPGSVEHPWISVAEAISWIRSAGGYAFIAHPLRYKMPEGKVLEDLVDEFVAEKGAGIEVVYNNLGRQQTELVADIARRYGLLASRGSDFHTIEEGVDIGAIPALPERLMPIEQVLH